MFLFGCKFLARSRRTGTKPHRSSADPTRQSGRFGKPESRLLHSTPLILAIHDYRANRHQETDKERLISFNLSAANDFFNKTQYEDALQCYQAVLREQSNNFDALTGKAATLEQLGHLEECLRTSRTILETPAALHDNLIAANEYRRMAEVLYQQKKYIEAHTAVRESLYRSPSQICLDLQRRIENDGNIRTELRFQAVNARDLEEEFQDAPFQVQNIPEKGRGLISRKDMDEGDALVSEAPLVACLDIESDNNVEHCAHCLRQLQPIKFAFTDSEAKETLSTMPVETFDQLKTELAMQFTPPVEIISKHGFKFCSTHCASEASSQWLEHLSPLIRNQDPRLKFLMPSLFPLDEGATINRVKGLEVREQACVELVTLLLARNMTDPQTWDRWVSRLAYAVHVPDVPLLQHELRQISYLKEIFPGQSHLLTPENFKRLKSAVDLNAFSVETNNATIYLGFSSEVEGEAPAPDARQLSVHVEVDDQKIVKGHALYRIGSFMNHSCDPNVGMVSPSFSSHAQWSLLRPVSKGQELVNSYIALGEDTQQSKEDRQHLLQLHYKFTCRCSLCTSTQ